MGIFSGIKNNFKKSEAAVVVQNLFELQRKGGMFPYDSAATATRLIEQVWQQKPDIFEGRFGLRPHKLAIAGVALGNAFSVFHNDPSMRASCLIALGEILKTAEVNSSLYNFSNVDKTLFQSALQMFSEEAG